MRSVSRSALVTASWLMVACSGDGTPEKGDRGGLGATASPIIGGKLDTTHDAVFALVDIVNNTACSGTIFKIDAATGTGWMITAAHCVLPDNSTNPPTPASLAQNLYVVEGDDYNVASSVYYQVIDYKTHPQAAPPNHDWCVIQFGGATDKIPTIPLLTPALDNLATNSAIEEVGFGQTANDPNNANSTRYYFDTKLANAIGYQAVSALTIASKGKASTGVACHGDSGGPWLYTVAGTQYVAAVDSIGDCMSGQVGARISPAVDTFINPYVNAGPLTQTCAQCEGTSQLGMGVCKASVSACAADTECNQLLQLCMCAQTDDACIQTCFTNHPAGRDLYTGIIDCICFDGCATSCATDQLCAKTKCGFQSGTASCETCIETSCCNEDSACWADKACHECADRSNPDPSCAGNALYNAFETCRTTTCAGTCTPGGAGGAGGGSGTGGGGGATTVGAGGMGGDTSVGAGGATSVGAGGDTSVGAGGAGGDTSVGAGGDTSVGAGGSGPSTGGAGPGIGGAGPGLGGAGPGPGAGGASTGGSGTVVGAGGNSTSAGGTANGAGGGKAGAGGKGIGGASTGAGGSATGAGGAKATGGSGASAGHAGAGGAGHAGTTGTTTTGLGGADSGGSSDGTGDTATEDASSGSSGGCSVPSAPTGNAGALLLGLAAILRLRRRR